MPAWTCLPAPRLVMAVLAAIVLAGSVMSQSCGSPELEGDWTAVDGAVPPSSVASFHWLFPHRELGWLERQFRERSDPLHPRYLQWLGNTEVLSRIGAPLDVKEPVLDWLRGCCTGGVQDYGDGLLVNTDVGTVERLFGVRMRRFKHVGTGLSVIRSQEELRIPVELLPSLHSIRGLRDFPPPTPLIRTPLSPLSTTDGSSDHPTDQSTSQSRPSHRANITHGSSPSRQLLQVGAQVNQQCPRQSYSSVYYGVSPAFLEAQYNVTSRGNDTTPSPASASVAGGVYTARGGYQAVKQADLDAYQVNLGYSAPFVPFMFNASGNAYELSLNPDSAAASEATLDIETLFFFSPTSNNSLYTALPTDGPYEVSLGYLLMPDADRPQVLSVSYVWYASDLSYNNADQGRTDVNWMRLGLLGVTVIVCSGDDGTEGWRNRNCNTDPNSLFTRPVSNTAGPMLPQYPASSPYVLSMGETGFLKSNYLFSQSVNSPPQCNNCPVPNPRGLPFLCQQLSGGEEVVSKTNSYYQYSHTSGGGFSSYAAAPWWQQAAVSKYLNVACGVNNTEGCVLPPSSYYNSGNRGYPDMSIFGGYWLIVLNGMEYRTSGTSVSAPLFAGLVARMNEVALARTGSSLGFINPLLYQMANEEPATFNDLTSGDNICPQSALCASTCSGFASAIGWDPVTGLGSPNFGRILAWLDSMLPLPSASTAAEATTVSSSSLSTTATASSVSSSSAPAAVTSVLPSSSSASSTLLPSTAPSSSSTSPASPSSASAIPQASSASSTPSAAFACTATSCSSPSSSSLSTTVTASSVSLSSSAFPTSSLAALLSSSLAPSSSAASTARPGTASSALPTNTAASTSSASVSSSPPSAQTTSSGAWSGISSSAALSGAAFSSPAGSDSSSPDHVAAIAAAGGVGAVLIMATAAYGLWWCRRISRDQVQMVTAQTALKASVADSESESGIELASAG